MNISWDAQKYTNDFSFVHEYGNSVMELIDFDNVKNAVDLGCGNGALTKKLKDKEIDVIGIDASEELLETAKSKYPDIEFIYGDAANFRLQEKVDLVFSNAVFHWIDEERQSDMIKCVYDALKNGGQFVFEFGGYGNNAKIHSALKAAFKEYGYEYSMPFYFPTIGDYSKKLENGGFLVKKAILFERPTLLKGENGMKDWIEMFVKIPFDTIADNDEKSRIIDGAVELLRDELYTDGDWYADYVRLRMKAVKVN